MKYKKIYTLLFIFLSTYNPRVINFLLPFNEIVRNILLLFILFYFLYLTYKIKIHENIKLTKYHFLLYFIVIFIIIRVLLLIPSFPDISQLLFGSLIAMSLSIIIKTDWFRSLFFTQLSYICILSLFIFIFLPRIGLPLFTVENPLDGDDLFDNVSFRFASIFIAPGLASYYFVSLFIYHLTNIAFFKRKWSSIIILSLITLCGLFTINRSFIICCSVIIFFFTYFCFRKYFLTTLKYILLIFIIIILILQFYHSDILDNILNLYLDRFTNSSLIENRISGDTGFLESLNDLIKHPVLFGRLFYDGNSFSITTSDGKLQQPHFSYAYYLLAFGPILIISILILYIMTFSKIFSLIYLQRRRLSTDNYYLLIQSIFLLIGVILVSFTEVFLIETMNIITLFTIYNIYNLHKYDNNSRFKG